MSSPSTTNTISAREADSLSIEAGAFGLSNIADALAAGKNALMVFPFPKALFTRISPLWTRIIPDTAANPNPRPANFVVKNGSNIFAFGGLIHAFAGILHFKAHIRPGRDLPLCFECQNVVGAQD